MHIYAFGSICRGEIEFSSDTDLIAIIKEFDDIKLNQKKFSIYKYSRIKELWEQGNPFAWHLFLEAKLIYSFDNSNLFIELREPNKYSTYLEDMMIFYEFYISNYNSILSSEYTRVFDLSNIFLSIRNFATSYSLGILRKPNFSRNSALQLGHDSLKLCESNYKLLERSRILSTRATGNPISNREIDEAVVNLSCIKQWMENLIIKSQKYERV
ncbi:nucleotidyltransferase [Silvanigrella sp.]|jgi:predicted nucleotidyltransferase|uniref:nucleotidyltransferase n=1 Tax=Silvanigrella sp. TaxID=2024976 RepID=UPI0037C92C26